MKSDSDDDEGIPALVIDSESDGEPDTRQQKRSTQLKHGDLREEFAKARHKRSGSKSSSGVMAGDCPGTYCTPTFKRAHRSRSRSPGHVSSSQRRVMARIRSRSRSRTPSPQPLVLLRHAPIASSTPSSRHGSSSASSSRHGSFSTPSSRRVSSEFRSRSRSRERSSSRHGSSSASSSRHGSSSASSGSQVHVEGHMPL